MTQITGLGSNGQQTFTIADPNGGGDITFTLYFRPRTRNWYADISFGSFILNGQKIIRGPNILSKHINNIPFGLCVTVSDNFEPYLINDFYSERVGLFLLTTAEVAEVETMIAEGFGPV